MLAVDHPASRGRDARWRSPRGAVLVAGLLAVASLGSAIAYPVLTADAQADPAGTVRFASTWAGDTDALKAVAEQFTATTGIEVVFNTPDPQTFSDQINSYLQATPDDVLTWYAGYRMRYYADQGLVADISDVWTDIGSNYSEAFRSASTGNDGKQYLIPFYNYPWVVIYRKSVFEEHDYAVPTTLDELLALGERMQSDGLVPFAFADKDGWPAQGWFDILDMRTNGYQFHVDLLAGKEKWTDPRVAAAFENWKQFIPLYGDMAGAMGRTWQDGANLLAQGQAGMLFFGTFAGTAITDPAVHDDLDFFPFPTLGTEFDAEMAIDAPINGFMVAAKSTTLTQNSDAIKAWLAYLGSGEGQSIFLANNPNFVASAGDADTSTYVPFQQRMSQIIQSSGKIAQFLDRDTDPGFAAQMQGFLQSFLQEPEQDLAAYTQGIQDFWDSLGIS